jgi:iron complex outermembrane recepter protein
MNLYQMRILGCRAIVLSLLMAASGLVRAQESSQSAGSMAGASNPTNTEQAPPAALPEVVVTGSRIPRRDYVADSPLSTVSGSDIAITGSTTVDTALEEMHSVRESGKVQTATAMGVKPI